MILHIANDEKFIDSAYRLFEQSLPQENELLIVSKSHYLRHVRTPSARVIPPRKLLEKGFVQSMVGYDAVFMHWMDEYKMQLIARAPRSVRFVWIGWGGDYYPFIVKDDDELLEEKTREAVMSGKPRSLRSLFRRLRRIVRKAFFFEHIDKIAVVNRINYFSPVVPEDYDLVKLSIPGFKPQYVSWNYGTLEDDMICGLSEGDINGDNILVGNSADYTNNHLDTFEVLSKIDLGDRKILCPLSYGHDWYRDVVIRRGKELFGENFVPIVNFMPIQEYTKMIASCSIAVMNHIRQQALGNIIIMLYCGARVFLHPRSPVYDFLSKQGALVFSFNSLLGGQLDFGRLNVESILENRRVLYRNWGREAMKLRTQNLLDTVIPRT